MHPGSPGCPETRRRPDAGLPPLRHVSPLVGTVVAVLVCSKGCGRLCLHTRDLAMLTLSWCPHCSALTIPEAMLTACPHCRHICTPAERYFLCQRWGRLQQIADAHLAFFTGCGMVMLSLPCLCVWLATGQGSFANVGGWLLASGLCLSAAILLFGEHYLYGAWETYVSLEESRRWTRSWTISAVMEPR